MMECLEYRRICGADPRNDDPVFVAHEQDCQACAGYAVKIRAFDKIIAEALRVDVPDSDVSRQAVPSPDSEVRSWHRPVWLGLAASLLMTVGVATGVWLSTSQQSIAESVIAHMGHEDYAMVATDQRLPIASVQKVMNRSGASIDQNLAAVSYARSCFFRGRFVPHLVVQGEYGPVTVMILPNVHVESATRFEEDGYKGTLLPSGEGSIAIISSDDIFSEDVENTISKAVEWRT